MTNEMTAEEAVEILKNKRDNDIFVWTEYREKIHQALTMGINAIKALEQTRWIPVSERLPEKQDCYLVTTKWKGSYSGDVYIETNMAVYREKQKEFDCVDVIAWQPLPQPYKAESEDKE